LPKLRPDIPKPLALAVHTLLAKRAEDRPRTAADARAMLLRSLVQPERVAQEIEPLSSTVAALGHGRGLVFRVGAPLALVLAFSAALFALGYTTESATQQQAGGAVASVSAVQPSMVQSKLALNTATTTQPIPAVLKLKAVEDRPTLTLEEARKKVWSISHGRATKFEIVETNSGQAIVAILDSRKSGSTYFFVMEKRDGRYQITSRGPLDAEGFRNAIWTIETVEADEDGYREVLFVGSNASDKRYARRLLLYVPNERRSYSVLLSGDMASRGNPKVIWSTNASGADAAPYRTMLRLKARTLQSVAKK